MTLKPALIFDLDGTLLDSLNGLMHSTNAALEACGYPARSYTEIRNFVGNGMRKLIERAVADGLEDPNFEKCFRLFRADYDATMLQNTVPYDGILTLLETLKAEGYPMAVVSNKADAPVRALCAHFFGDLLPISIGEQEGVARKPAPDSVFAALEALGCPREHAFYIGDSEVDMETARNAGLPCLSVGWGYRDPDFLSARGADFIASSTEALLAEIHQRS